MRTIRLFIAILFLTGIATAQTLQCGSGAATPSIMASFMAACNRGTFPLTTPQATSSVKPLTGASPALVQEFSAAGAGTGAAKAALIKADPNAPPGSADTLQVYTDIYTFYQAIGAATAGVPLADTQACPANAYGVCDYQAFSKNYVLFVYSTAGSQSISLADPFYSVWNASNGLTGPFGVATGNASTVVSTSKTSGTEQTFAGGVMFSYIVSGTTATYAVSGVIYATYAASGDFALLGFPTSAEITLPSGVHRQTFEGARIEWTPGQSTAAVFFPLTNLDILGEAQGLIINAGATATLTAVALDTRNNSVTNRQFTWSTSNGSVAMVTGNGVTAAVRGLTSGTANIYVSAEGKTSPAFAVTVKGICCGIGEGAPTQAITQAFQAAVTRNNLTPLLPNATGVVRAGSGYVQILNAADGTIYAVAESDKSSTAYVMSGAVYVAFLASGGFGGSLGYPASDVLAGGVQVFESGAALAGNPVLLVPAAVARRWVAAGGATGSLGSPVAAATDFQSFAGSAGTSQLFAGGAVFGYTGGSRAGQGFVSSGLILARYLALSGPAGALGGPISDLTNAGTVQSQNFEGGYIDLQTGAAAAVEHLNPRVPAVTVQPTSVAPGGRVRITVSGFALGGNISVTVTGQPTFNVAPASGSFSWDTIIAANARPATVVVQAKAAAGTDAASASYTISSALALLPRWTVISGDRQNGLPGSALQLPVIAQLTDAGGNPVPNVPVNVVASPGAVAQSSGVTGTDGRITVSLRLPPSSGVTVLSLTAAGQVVTLSALAAASTITGFPMFPTADSTLLGPGPGTFAQQGSLLYTLAALIRYQQNSGLLPSPNGLATPVLLNQYLLAKSGFSPSESGAPIVDPWIAAQFAGSNASVSVSPATLDSVHDALSAGSPAGIILNVSIDGQAAGSTVVSAIGAGGDGAIVIADPNPSFGRSALGDYLGGFSVQGHQVTATLGSLIRIVPAASPGGFVLAAPFSAGASVNSVAGVCPAIIDLAEAAVIGSAAHAPLRGVRFIECDESANSYEVELQAASGAAVLDLAGGAPVLIPLSSSKVYQVTRVGGTLQVEPQTLTIVSVVDAAIFGPNLAPGEIFTVFGTGLRPELTVPPAVTVNGQSVSLLASLPFQINAQLPPGLEAGSAVLQISNALGVVSRTITTQVSAPAIFVLGTNAGGGQQGAIVNQDGTINGTNAPATRGQSISIYCTGLGTTALRGGLAVTTASVTVSVNGTSLIPSYAGPAPGFIGLYQVNVQIPGNVYPGSGSSLQLLENGQTSNLVAFALQ